MDSAILTSDEPWYIIQLSPSNHVKHSSIEPKQELETTIY